MEWQQLDPADDHAESVADQLRRTRLHSGRTLAIGGPSFADTWEWNGNDWRPLTTFPRLGRLHMTFDYAKSRVMLFGLGGLNDAWHPPANSAGLTASNAGEGKIGAK
jgi:hypothetical protein